MRLLRRLLGRRPRLVLPSPLVGEGRDEARGVGGKRPQPAVAPHPHPNPPPSRGREQRARRAVLAGIAFVLLAHAGLNVALDTVKPQWRDPEYGHRAKRLAEIDRTRGGRPLVVALGSSRTQMGFSPADLSLDDGPDSPVAYNMGQAGAGPLLQLLNLHRLLAAGVRPDAVLVEVMPPALAKGGPAEHVLFPHVPRFGSADVGRLAPYCDDPAALRRDWAKVRVSPWYSLRFLLMSHALPGFLPWDRRVDFQWRMLDRHGWSAYPFDPVPADVRDRGTAAARTSYEATLADFRVAPLMDRCSTGSPAAAGWWSSASPSCGPCSRWR